MKNAEEEANLTPENTNRCRNSSIESDHNNFEQSHLRKESDNDYKNDSPSANKKEDKYGDELLDNKSLSLSSKNSKKYSKRGTMGPTEKLNYDVYIKIEQLSKEVYRISNEKDKLAKDLEKSEESKTSINKRLEETKEQLNNCTKNYYEMLKECESLKNSIETFKKEKIFFQQVS